MQTAQRNTKQKQAVYEALVALGHPSATEVYEYVRRGLPNISRGTVFRVLSSFADSGRARRLCMEGSDVRYDAMLEPHAHARCRRCGAVCDVYLPHFGQLSEGVGTGGFRIDGCEVEFFGLCASCSETN